VQPRGAQPPRARPRILARPAIYPLHTEIKIRPGVRKGAPRLGSKPIHGIAMDQAKKSATNITPVERGGAIRPPASRQPAGNCRAPRPRPMSYRRGKQTRITHEKTSIGTRKIVRCETWRLNARARTQGARAAKPRPAAQPKIERVEANLRPHADDFGGSTLRPQLSG
jgi:hypothetical protein